MPLQIAKWREWMFQEEVFVRVLHGSRAINVVSRRGKEVDDVILEIKHPPIRQYGRIFLNRTVYRFFWLKNRFVAWLVFLLLEKEERQAVSVVSKEYIEELRREELFKEPTEDEYEAVWEKEGDDV